MSFTADQYAIARIDNRIISALADGCSWGVEPKEAAHRSIVYGRNEEILFLAGTTALVKLM